MSNNKNKKKDSPGRAITLKNYENSNYLLGDTLHGNAIKQKQSQASCTPHRCLGSLLVDVAGFPNKSARSREETRKQAEDFIHQYYAFNKQLDSDDYAKRIKSVNKSIKKTGTYEMTYDELTFGAKSAWRNAPRCIGRIQWSKLQIIDGRHVTTARQMFDLILDHLKYVTNGGNIRSAITVFPPRKPGTVANDFKIWNSLMIGYAGFKKPDGTIVGDPKGLELAEVAMKLGWKPPTRERFDVLPLVVQANGQDPEFFEIPHEYVLEVNIKHNKFPKLRQLDIKWFAVPGVSNMVFDCGGLEYTGAPFSGWYMSTEVATRDFLDSGRYNLLKEAADAFGIQRGSNTTLWKDEVSVEMNRAVIDSYTEAGVTIMDHHSASESFMKHLENEQKARGGCPADWVWIVPPMGGSLTEVFHQEMLNYKLKPSYEYQEMAWRIHRWKTQQNITLFGRNEKKVTFKAASKAVMFASILIKGMHQKRKKCTILYATETGRSEMFAKKLKEMFQFAFNTIVVCMEDYNVRKLPAEDLLFVVAATTGNGSGPTNGLSFMKAVQDRVTSMTKNGVVSNGVSNGLSNGLSNGVNHTSHNNNNSSKDNVTFMQDILSCCKSESRKVEPLHLNEIIPSQMTGSHKVSYSVFGLGSRAYPNFCAFAHEVNDILHEKGAEVLYAMGEGCEIEGQEEPFNEWAIHIFKEASKKYQIDDLTVSQSITSLGAIDKTYKADKFRFVNLSMRGPDLVDGLTLLHNKTVKDIAVKEQMNLSPKSKEEQKLLISLAHDKSAHFTYQAGDHIGIYPSNDATLVHNILNKATDCPPKHQTFTIDIQSTEHGRETEWDDFSRLPATTILQALTNFLDITTPPSQRLLAQLVNLTENQKDKEELQKISKNSQAYQQWKKQHWPHIAEIFDLFPSLRIPALFLLTQLPVLQPRYFSISSSPVKTPDQVHITLKVVDYTTPAGKLHKGVCTHYLKALNNGDSLPCFLRSAGGFHMPPDLKTPIIMVGTGTGLAPFRSFWQQRQMDRRSHKDKKFGLMHLYFGCRTSEDNFYEKELKEAESAGVLSKVYLALSREPNKPKTYVQHYLLKNKQEVHDIMVNQGGNFYVCGAVNMAQEVNQALLQILKEVAGMSDENAANYFARLKSNLRYHEDIFGAAF